MTLTDSALLALYAEMGGEYEGDTADQVADLVSELRRVLEAPSLYGAARVVDWWGWPQRFTRNGYQAADGEWWNTATAFARELRDRARDYRELLAEVRG